MAINMKSKLRHGATKRRSVEAHTPPQSEDGHLALLRFVWGMGRGAETSNLKPQASGLSQLSQNRKAQLEIVALAFMIAGVVTIASAGLLSTGGGAKARSIYEQNFIAAEQKVSEMETFYSTLVNLAARNVLKAEGHNLDDFCPAAVKADDALKDKIRKEIGNQLSANEFYEETKLPLMETASKKGILNIVPAGQASFAVGEGKRYDYQTKVNYDLDKEYYVTDITATVATAGGSVATISAKDASGKETCTHNIPTVPHTFKTETFSCNRGVKSISASTAFFVDNFAVTLKTPYFLKITGLPAEPIKVEKGEIKLSSDGYFSAEIPATVKEIKPNFIVEGLIFNDDPSVKSVEVNKPVKISASFKNAGCGSVEDEFKYQIYTDKNLLAEGKAKGVPPGGTVGISETFTPTKAGTYDIIAKIDPDNKIPESNENDNEKAVSLLVTLPPLKSCSDVGGQCKKSEFCKTGTLNGQCSGSQQVCCNK